MTKISDIPVKPKSELTLDDIQNEDWLLRTMEKAANPQLDIKQAVLDELDVIMAELAEDYHKGEPSIPVIRETCDLETLALKEARYLALLSRVAQITLGLYHVRKRVEELWDMCEERLNRYPAVSRELTNDRKRTLFYKAALKPLRDKQVKVELSMEVAQKVESHLTQVHFAIREISELGRAFLLKTRA